MPRAFLVFIFVLIRPSIMRANNSIDSARWIPLGWYDFTQSASSRTGRNSFRTPHSCVCHRRRRAPFIRSRAAQVKTTARIDKTSLSIDTTPTLSEREESTFNFQPRWQNDGNDGGKANLESVRGGLSISIRNCLVYTLYLKTHMEWKIPPLNVMINNQRLLQNGKYFTTVFIEKENRISFSPIRRKQILDIFAEMKLRLKSY